jgi:hypothetical protein
MSRSCLRSHRCTFVVIRLRNMTLMTTIARMMTIVSASQSATKHAPPQAPARPLYVLLTKGDSHDRQGSFSFSLLSRAPMRVASNTALSAS